MSPSEGKAFPSKLCVDAWDLKTFGDCGSGHVAVHRGGVTFPEQPPMSLKVFRDHLASSLQRPQG